MSDRLIDKLKASFEARRTMVPILGMEVWVTPLTMGEQTTIATMHPEDGAMRMAETLIRKCKDADDKPIFERGDKAALKASVAGDSLGPLISAIVGPSMETQLKNSEADEPAPTSDTP
jgi:hypothetical protein